MDDGVTVDVLYFDISKAFGSVNYKFLVAKRELFGQGEKTPEKRFEELTEFKWPMSCHERQGSKVGYLGWTWNDLFPEFL